MALVDTPTLLNKLDIADASDAAVVTHYDLLRQQIEGAVKDYVKWEIEQQQDQVDYYDGKDYWEIVLRRPFVTQVANVWHDPAGAYNANGAAFQASTLLTAGNQYCVVMESPGISKCGIIRRLPGPLSVGYWLFPSDLLFAGNRVGLSYAGPPVWPRGSGNIKVLYDYGFPTGTQVTAATWSGGVGTLTVSSSRGYWVGQLVTIINVLPAGWNGTWVVRSVPDGTTVNVGMANNPGSLTGAGTMDGVPPAIKIAVEGAVGQAQFLRYGGNMIVGSEGLGDYNYSLTMMQHPAFLETRRLLAPYRDSVLGIALA